MAIITIEGKNNLVRGYCDFRTLILEKMGRESADYFDYIVSKERIDCIDRVAINVQDLSCSRFDDFKDGLERITNKISEVLEATNFYGTKEIREIVDNLTGDILEVANDSIGCIGDNIITILHNEE